MKRFAPKTTLEITEIAGRAADAYARLQAEYVSTGDAAEFDFREHCLSWTVRSDVYTHRFHRYPARLTPYIPLYLLSVPALAKSMGTLLDPFAGCGTVMVEGPVHPVHPMQTVGVEVNPLARLIAKVKTTPLDLDEVKQGWTLAREKFKLSRRVEPFSEFPSRDLWFTERAQRELARARQALMCTDNVAVRDFLLLCLSSVVRRVSLADPSVSVPVRLNPARWKNAVQRNKVTRDLAKRQRARVIDLLDDAVSQNMERLRAWTEARVSPSLGATLLATDARNLVSHRYVSTGAMEQDSGTPFPQVDLLITSPPYVNAQRYTRSLRLELFALGITSTFHEEGDLDRLQLGTERVPLADRPSYFGPTGSRTADITIEAVRRTEEMRAAILAKYVHEMRAVLRESYRVLRPGAAAVFVVGNNTVRGIEVRNDAILREIACGVGFITELVVCNQIPSRGLLTKRNSTAGVITHEYVVILRRV